MSDEKDAQKSLLQEQIEELNNEIKKLGYSLEGILDVNCSLGLCAFDPEVDDVQKKIVEVEKKRGILEKIRDSLDSCAAD